MNEKGTVLTIYAEVNEETVKARIEGQKINLEDFLMAYTAITEVAIECFEKRDDAQLTKEEQRELITACIEYAFDKKASKETTP